LQAIRGLQAFFETCRRVRLAGQEHVGVVLSVGGEAEIDDAKVGVQHVAALDDALVGRRRPDPAFPAIVIDGWNHCRGPSGYALAHPPGDLAGRDLNDHRVRTPQIT
jgi:hypothetical protein